MGLFTDVFGFLAGAHQNKLANQIHPVYSAYQSSPYAAAQLGTALNAYNGRMAGASTEESNIAASQAQYQNAVDANATSGSQALALGALNQGKANQAYGQLGVDEAQNKYNLLNNLNAGYGAMVKEGDKLYQDAWQKYQSDVQAKTNLRNSAYQNMFGALNDLSGTLFNAGQQQSNNGNSKLGNTLSTASLFL